MGDFAKGGPAATSRTGLSWSGRVADSAGDVNASSLLALTRAALTAILLALPMATGGCQSDRLAEAYTHADDFKAFIGVAYAEPTEPADTRYRVAAPDTLAITVLRDGEAIDYRVTLPPDGRLLLPGLAWPVETHGLTAAEISEGLRRSLTADGPPLAALRVKTEAETGADANDDTKDAGATPASLDGLLANRGLSLDRATTPAPVAEAASAAAAGAQSARRVASDTVYVSVRVDRFASRRVFAFGQVGDPGAQAWDGTNRLSSVLAAARPGRRADLNRVLVLRPAPDGTPRRRLVISARRMLDTGDNTLDVTLAPDDIVFVPATGLGRVGLAIDQLRPTPRTRAETWGTRPGPFFPSVAYGCVGSVGSVGSPRHRAGHRRVGRPRRLHHPHRSAPSDGR